MAKKEFGVAVIGCGNRGRGVSMMLLKDSKNMVKVVSAYDPDPALVERAIKENWQGNNPVICKSAEEAINTPGVDWVMVFSPNAFHKEHILAAFKAGKHVFSEKPLATSIADCQEIYQAQQKCGLMFATGFVLRYAPIYRKVKELLNSGRFGKIIAVEANENIRPAHGGYIMTNWRRLTKWSGPHILEKCCHDLDLINWFTESVPSKVAAFGGRDFFKPSNNYLFEKYGKKVFRAWEDPHAEETPFTDDTDMEDNTIAVAQFRNNIRVSFSATMSNPIPERRMSFTCTEGNIRVELYSSKIEYRHLSDEGTTTIDFGADGHGGGDNTIMKELYESMSEGVAPKCSGAEGLRSAVYALAIDQASKSHQVVDLEPIWKSLDV